MPKWLLALAALRAAEGGVGADRVLIAEGAISEETYVTALADWLGMDLDPLSDRSRNEIPLSDDRLIEAANTGLLPVVEGNDVNFVVAPRLVDSRRLAELASSRPDLVRRIRLTSVACLHSFVTRHARRAIARKAIDGLRVEHPEFSAASGRRDFLTVAVLGAAIALTAIASRDIAWQLIEFVLSSVFLAWTGLRLFGLASEPFARRRKRAFTEGSLPTYTVAVALYREAAGVKDLVAALRALNYPALGSKLT